jgi:hypothetical protein
MQWHENFFQSDGNDHLKQEKLTSAIFSVPSFFYIYFVEIFYNFISNRLETIEIYNKE